MRAGFIIAAAVMLLPLAGLAQQQPQGSSGPPHDPRLDASQIEALSDTVRALNSQMTYMQQKAAAELAELGAKAAQRERDWAQYARSLYAPPVPAAEPKS